MAFILPRDENSDIVQALSPVDTVTQSVSNSGQVRFTIPANTDILRFAAGANCYIKFGNSSVVATTSDIFFPIGAEVFSILGRGYTHVSILGADVTPAPASITKMV